MPIIDVLMKPIWLFPKKLRDHALGHRNIQHTVRYTATNPTRFERLWR